MIKVSVIIPVYNVELYLRECLDSIINQTLKEIEIICIDDCSSDNSYSILEEYSNIDNRVKIFRNKINIGPGPSRNIGIRASQGEYISFIDSDDFISTDYLEILYLTAQEYNSDIVNTLNIYKYFDSNNKCRFWSHLNIMELNYLKYETYYPLENYNLYNSVEKITTGPCNKIFRKKFIIDNDVFFMDDRIGMFEDADFILRLLLNKPNVSFNNIAEYFYRQIDTSSMHILEYSLEHCISAFNHFNNTLSYCLDKFPSLFNLVSIKVYDSIFYIFNLVDTYIKRDLYIYVYKIISRMHITEEDLASEYYSYEDRYNEYCIIISSPSYDKYIVNKNIFLLRSEITMVNNKINDLSSYFDSNNWVRLFGINNLENKIIIIFFGIKITLNRKSYRTEQNRTEQNRTEQNRTEITYTN